MNAEKITRNILDEMCELKILEFDSLEDGYLITDAFSKRCNEALKFLDENPHLISDDFDNNLSKLLVLAYFRMLGEVNEDKLKLHVNIIISMLELWEDRRMQEFSARLRLLERVKK